MVKIVGRLAGSHGPLPLDPSVFAYVHFTSAGTFVYYCRFYRLSRLIITGDRRCVLLNFVCGFTSSVFEDPDGTFFMGSMRPIISFAFLWSTC